MPASFPEDGDEQIGRRIHNKRMLIELGGGIDEASKAQALAGTVQFAATGDLQLRNDIEQGKPGGFLALFQREFAPQPTLVTKVVAPERTLNTDEESTGLLERKVVADRSCQGRQHHPESLKTCLDRLSASSMVRRAAAD